MKVDRQNRLLRFGILFFGTFGLGLFGHGTYRFFTRGNNPWLLLVAGIGLCLFAFCWLVKVQFQNKR